jgi:hypothetical protein
LVELHIFEAGIILVVVITVISVIVALRIKWLNLSPQSPCRGAQWAPYDMPVNLPNGCTNPPIASMRRTKIHAHCGIAFGARGIARTRVDPEHLIIVTSISASFLNFL